MEQPFLGFYLINELQQVCIIKPKYYFSLHIESKRNASKPKTYIQIIKTIREKEKIEIMGKLTAANTRSTKKDSERERERERGGLWLPKLEVTLSGSQT